MSRRYAKWSSHPLLTSAALTAEGKLSQFDWEFDWAFDWAWVRACMSLTR